MILVRNNAALTTPVSIAETGAVVPFDTTVLSTNHTTALSNNAISIKAPGVYTTECQVTVTNSAASAVTVTLSFYADGEAVTGATAVATIGAAETETISIPWTDQVVYASSGTANVGWYLSGGSVELNNAIASVIKLH